MSYFQQKWLLFCLFIVYNCWRKPFFSFEYKVAWEIFDRIEVENIYCSNMCTTDKHLSLELSSSSIKE